MCGIAGFVNLDGAPADTSVLRAMTDMIRHRGPDDRETLCLSLCGFSIVFDQPQFSEGRCRRRQATAVVDSHRFVFDEDDRWDEAAG
jgi:asparagine synthetase B (glutamine-hydrolysing)